MGLHRECEHFKLIWLSNLWKWNRMITFHSLTPLFQWFTLNFSLKGNKKFKFDNIAKSFMYTKCIYVMYLLYWPESSVDAVLNLIWWNICKFSSIKRKRHTIFFFYIKLKLERILFIFYSRTYVAPLCIRIQYRLLQFFT